MLCVDDLFSSLFKRYGHHLTNDRLDLTISPVRPCRMADEIADRGGLDKTEPYTTVHSDKNIDEEPGG